LCEAIHIHAMVFKNWLTTFHGCDYRGSGCHTFSLDVCPTIL